MVMMFIMLLAFPIPACSMEQDKNAIQLEPLPQQIPQRIMLTHARSIDHPTIRNGGLVKINNINYLEWHAKDYLLKKRFSDLMEEKRKQKLPLLVALLTKKDCGDTNAQYIHEGKAFYDCMNKVFSKYSNVFGDKYYCKVLDVEFYAIWNPSDSQADFLGTKHIKFQCDQDNLFYFLDPFFEWQDKPNNPELKHQIGCHYKKQKKYAQANQWLQEAADQGYAKAYNDLGEVLYFGYKQTDKALPWFLKAAENNDLFAYGHVGAIYYDKQEYTIAQKYLEQGANQWFIAEHTIMNERESNERLQFRARMQFLLAKIYEKQNDLANAKKWYEQASKYHPDAKKEYERLKNQKS